MKLYTEIHDFFNEGRPRTVNQDVVDIKKGQYIYQGEKPKEPEKTILKRKEPNKKDFSKQPTDIDQKSSFKKGEVHRIVFKTAFKDQKRAYFSIYRKISEQEYNDLKRNYTIGATVYPVNKKEHFEDIYYLNPGEGIRNEKEGFVHLDDAQIKEIKDKYSKYMSEFNPVSIEEIAKGLNIRYYNFDNLKAFWDERMAGFKRSKDKGSAKAARDAEKAQGIETEVKDFVDNNKEKLIKITGLYDKSIQTSIKPDDKKDYEDLAKAFIQSYVRDLKKLSKPAAAEVITKLREKLKDRNYLFNLIQSSYEGKAKPSTEPSGAVQKNDKTQKDKKEPDNKKETLDAKQKAEKYINDNKYIVNINNLIKAYAASEERDEKGVYVNDREERNYQRDQALGRIPKVMDQIFKYRSSDEVRDAIIDRIEIRVDGLIGAGDESEALNKILRKGYDNMKKKQVKEGTITEATKKYLVKTKPGSRADSVYKKDLKDQNKDAKGIPIPGEYIISLEDDQIPKLNAKGMKDLGIIRTDLYEPEPEKPTERTPEEMSYKISTKVGDGKEQDGNMTGKNIIKYLKTNPEYSNISFKDLKEKQPYKLKGKEGQNIVITIKSLTPFGQSGKRNAFDTIDAAQSKRDRKANEPETRKVSVRIPYQTPQTVSYAVNKGVKMAKVNPAELTYKFYVVDVDKNEPVKGFDNWGETKREAQKMGPKYKAMQKGEIISNKVNEALSKEDITKLKSSRMSFTIQSQLKADEQYNVSDTVKEVKEEKGNIIIELSQAGTVTFDKEGTGKFFYKKDKQYYQTLNVPQATLDIIKKALAPSKDTKEPESQLEAYIRKRIRQAIKEAQVSQYWGYQGKDVKKKRLEEYLKRYEWGFQDSNNPYTHSNGSAIHAIVSKLVHELAAMGVNAIAIFNSYAPEGYQVSDLNQLDYASDSPLGSQLTQPYNPDSLTARGGRIAEANEEQIDAMFDDNVPMDQQLKNAEELASDYMRDRTLSQGIQKNPNLYHVEKTIVKFIQKASEEGTRKDIDPKSKILQALRVISDRQMNKYR